VFDRLQLLQQPNRINDPRHLCHTVHIRWLIAGGVGCRLVPF
jgi:hypothetical protein